MIPKSSFQLRNCDLCQTAIQIIILDSQLTECEYPCFHSCSHGRVAGRVMYQTFYYTGSACNQNIVGWNTGAWRPCISPRPPSGACLMFLCNCLSAVPCPAEKPPAHRVLGGACVRAIDRAADRRTLVDHGTHSSEACEPSLAHRVLRERGEVGDQRSGNSRSELRIIVSVKGERRCWWRLLERMATA